MSNTKDNDRKRQRDRSANSSYEPPLSSRHSQNGVQQSEEKKTKTKKKAKSDAYTESADNKGTAGKSVNISPQKHEMPKRKGGRSKSVDNYLSPSMVSDSPAKVKDALRNKEGPQSSRKKTLSPSFPSEKIEKSRDKKSRPSDRESRQEPLLPTVISPHRKKDSKEKVYRSQSAKKYSSPPDVKKPEEHSSQPQNKKKQQPSPNSKDLQKKKDDGKEKNARSESKKTYPPPSMLPDTPAHENKVPEKKGSKKNAAQNYPPPSFPSDKPQQIKSVSKNNESANEKEQMSPSFLTDTSPKAKTITKDNTQLGSPKATHSSTRKEVKEGAEASNNQQTKLKTVILNTSLVEKIQKENIQATTDFLTTGVSERKEQVRKIQEMAKFVLDNYKTEPSLASKSSTSVTDMTSSSSNDKTRSPPNGRKDKAKESITSRSVSEPRKKKSETDYKRENETNIRSARDKSIRASPSQEKSVMHNGDGEKKQNNGIRSKSPSPRVKSENSNVKLSRVPSSDRLPREQNQGDSNKITASKAKNISQKAAQLGAENRVQHTSESPPAKKKTLNDKKQSHPKRWSPEVISRSSPVTQPTILTTSDISVYKNESPIKKERLSPWAKNNSPQKVASETEKEVLKSRPPCVSPKQRQTLDKKTGLKPDQQNPERIVDNSSLTGPSIMGALNMFLAADKFGDMAPLKDSINIKSVQAKSRTPEKQHVQSQSKKSPPVNKSPKTNNKSPKRTVPSLTSDTSLLEQDLSPKDKTAIDVNKGASKTSDPIQSELPSPKQKKAEEDTPLLSHSFDKLNKQGESVVIASTSKPDIVPKEREIFALPGIISNLDLNKAPSVNQIDSMNVQASDSCTAQIINAELERSVTKPVSNLGEYQFECDIGNTVKLYALQGELSREKSPPTTSVACNDYSCYKAERQVQFDNTEVVSPPRSQSPCKSGSPTKSVACSPQPFSIRVVGTDPMEATGKGKSGKDCKKKKKKKCDSNPKPSVSRSMTGCAVKCEEEVPKRKRRSRSEESVCENSKSRGNCTPRCENRRCPGRGGSSGGGGGGCGRGGGFGKGPIRKPYCPPGEFVNGWFGRISNAIGCQLQHIAGTRGRFIPPCCTGFYRFDNSTTGWLENACPDERSSCSESTTARAHRKKKRKTESKDDEDTDSQIETMPNDDNAAETKKHSKKSHKKETKEIKDGGGKRSSGSGSKPKPSKKDSVEEVDERRRSSIPTLQDGLGFKDSPKLSILPSQDDIHSEEDAAASQETSLESEQNDCEDGCEDDCEDCDDETPTIEPDIISETPFRSNIPSLQSSIRGSENRRKSSVQSSEAYESDGECDEGCDSGVLSPVLMGGAEEMDFSRKSGILKRRSSHPDEDDTLEIEIEQSEQQQRVKKSNLKATDGKSVGDCAEGCSPECSLPLTKQSRGGTGQSETHSTLRRETDKALSTEYLKKSNASSRAGSTRQLDSTISESAKQSRGDPSVPNAESHMKTRPCQSKCHSGCTKDCRSDCVKESHNTLPPGSAKHSQFTYPPGSVKQSRDTHPPGSVRQPQDTLPPGSVRQPQDTLPPGSAKHSKFTYPPGSVKQSRDTHPPGSVRQPQDTLPPGSAKYSQFTFSSGSIKQSRGTLPQRSVKPSHITLPPGSVTQSHDTLPPGSVKQSGVHMSPESAKQSRGAISPEGGKQSCGKQSCGQQSCGQQSCGQQSCGKQSCGQQSCGQQSCGKQSCGQRPCGKQSCGQQPCGKQSCGQKTCGQKPCGQQSGVQQPCGQQPCGQQSCGQQSCDLPQPRYTKQSYHTPPHSGYDSGGNQSDHGAVVQSKCTGDDSYMRQIKSERPHRCPQSDRKTYGSSMASSASRSPCSPLQPCSRPNAFLESISGPDSPPRTLLTSPSAFDEDSAYRCRYNPGPNCDYSSPQSRRTASYYRHRSADHSSSISAREDLSPQRKSNYLRKLEQKCKSGTDRHGLPFYRDYSSISPGIDESRWMESMLRNCATDDVSAATTTLSNPRRPYPNSCMLHQSHLKREASNVERAVSRECRTNLKHHKRSASFSKYSSRHCHMDDSDTSRRCSKLSNFSTRDRRDTTSHESDSLTSTECMERSNVLYSRLSTAESANGESTRTKSSIMHKHTETDSASEATLTCPDHPDSCSTSCQTDELETERCGRDYASCEELTSDGLDCGDNECKRPKVRGRIIIRKPEKMKNTEICLQNMKVKMECRSYEDVSPKISCNAVARRSDGHQYEARDKTSNRRKNPESDSDKGTSFSHPNFLTPEIKHCQSLPYENPRTREGKGLILSQKVIDLPSESDSSRTPKQRGTFPPQHMERLRMRLLPEQRIDCFHQIITPEQPTCICAGEKNKTISGYFEGSEGGEKPIALKEQHFYSSEAATSITASQVQTEYEEVYNFGKSLLEDDMEYMSKPVTQSEVSVFSKAGSSLFDTEFDDITSSHSMAIWSKDKNASSSGNNNQSSSADLEDADNYYSNGIRKAMEAFNANLLSLSRNEPMNETVDLNHMRLIPDSIEHQKEKFSIGDFIDPSVLKKKDPKMVFDKIRENSQRALVYASNMANVTGVRTFRLSGTDFTSNDCPSENESQRTTRGSDDKSTEWTSPILDKRDVGTQVGLSKPLPDLRATSCEIHSYDAVSDMHYCFSSSKPDMKSGQRTNRDNHDEDLSNLTTFLVNSIIKSTPKEKYKTILEVENSQCTDPLPSDSDFYPIQCNRIGTPDELESETTPKTQSMTVFEDFRLDENDITSVTCEETLVIKNESFQEPHISPVDISIGSMMESLESDVECVNSISCCDHTTDESFKVEIVSKLASERQCTLDKFVNDQGGNFIDLFQQAGDMTKAPEYKEQPVPRNTGRARNKRISSRRAKTHSDEISDDAKFNPSKFVKQCLENEIEKALELVYNETFNTMSNNSFEQDHDFARSNNAIQFPVANCDVSCVETIECLKEEPKADDSLNDESLLDWVKAKLSLEIGKLVSRFDWSAISKENALVRKSSLKGSSVDFCNTGPFSSQCPKIQFSGLPSSSNCCGGYSDNDAPCQDRINDLQLFQPNPASHKRCSRCYQKQRTVCCHLSAQDFTLYDHSNESFEKILKDIKTYKPGDSVRTSENYAPEPNNNACGSRTHGDDPFFSTYTWNAGKNFELPIPESSVDSECHTTIASSRVFQRCPVVRESVTGHTPTGRRGSYRNYLDNYIFKRSLNGQNICEKKPVESSVDSACYPTSLGNPMTKHCTMNEDIVAEIRPIESSVDRCSFNGDLSCQNEKMASPIFDRLHSGNEYPRQTRVKSRSHTVLNALSPNTTMVSPTYCYSAESLAARRKASQQKYKHRHAPTYPDGDRRHSPDARGPFTSFVSNSSRNSKSKRNAYSIMKSNSSIFPDREYKSSFMKKEKPSSAWKNEIYESLSSVSDPAEAFVRMYLSMASRSRSRRGTHDVSREMSEGDECSSRRTNTACNFINSLSGKNGFKTCSVKKNGIHCNRSYNSSEIADGESGNTYRVPNTDINCNRQFHHETDRSRETTRGDILSSKWTKAIRDEKQNSRVTPMTTASIYSFPSYSHRNYNQSANNGPCDASPQESISDSSDDSDDGMIVDKVPFVDMCLSDVTSHKGINRSEAVLDLPSLCRQELSKKPGERLPFFTTMKHLRHREKHMNQEPRSEPIYQTSHFRKRENGFSDFARKNLNSSGNIIHTLSREDLIHDDHDDYLDGSEEDFHSAEEDMAPYPPRSSEVDAQKPRYLCPHHVTDMCNHRHNFSLADECSRIQLQDLCRNCSCLMKYCQGMKRDLKPHYCKASNICDGMNNTSQAMCFSNNRSEQEERNIALPFYRTLSEKCKGQPKIFKMGGCVGQKCVPNTIKDFVNWYACDDEEKDSNMQSVGVNNKGVSQYLCSSKTERNGNCQDMTSGKGMSQTMKEDPTAHGDVQNENFTANKSTISNCDMETEKQDSDAIMDASSSSYEDTDEDDCDHTSIEHLGYRMLKGVIDSKMYGDKHLLSKSKTHSNYRDTMRRSRAPLRRHASKLKRSRAINRFLQNDDDSFVRDKTHKVYHRGESHGDVSDSTSLEDIQVPQVDKGRVRFACDKNGEWAEVGRGSYGCVYLGLLDGEIEVAIKDFYESNSYDHVIHEARMLVYLQGTGITPKFYGLRRRFDTTKQPGEYCIIMEYFGDGKTLFNVLSEKIELTTTEWLDVLGQLVAGLRLIHRRNVLINDLKADNILIDLNSARKTIRYIDVGMATYKQGLTFQLPQNQMGKYNFLAPEVRDGLHTSKRSDIYSLGYMLDQIRRVAGDSLSGLESLVTQCMREEPKMRPYIDEIVSKVHKLVKSTNVTNTVSDKNCILISNSV